jgi:ubiquitin carboxyl-terminal hydrolase 5/13
METLGIDIKEQIKTEKTI